jgi:hypothetical protein
MKVVKWIVSCNGFPRRPSELENRETQFSLTSVRTLAIPALFRDDQPGLPKPLLSQAEMIRLRAGGKEMKFMHFLPCAMTGIQCVHRPCHFERKLAPAFTHEVGGWISIGYFEPSELSIVAGITSHLRSEGEQVPTHSLFFFFFFFLPILSPFLR